MNDRDFVFTYRTRFGTFRIQAHNEKFGLFFDYPDGTWDLKTTCVSVDDGIDYVEHQDTGIAEWDGLPDVPDAVRHIEHWRREPLRRPQA